MSHAPGRLAYLVAALPLAFLVADRLLASATLRRLVRPVMDIGCKPLPVYAFHFIPFGALRAAGFGDGESPRGEVALGGVLLAALLLARFLQRKNRIGAKGPSEPEEKVRAHA